MTIATLLCALLSTLPGTLPADGTPVRAPMSGHTAAAPAAAGVIRGIVVDTDTRQPVAWAHIAITDLHRMGMADGKGRFTVTHVPAGIHSIRASHIGYRETTSTVTTGGDDTVDVVLELAPSPINAGEIIVEDRHDRSASTPVLDLSGAELRARLGGTIAETLVREPGLDQRTMGAAPARPVLRGLGGDRLLLLEDGERTGDLSATSADHATVLDPLTAQRIEIIRGPGALLYGSNTLGGVINVERNYIPALASDHLHGSASTQLESVNGGYAGAATLSVPAGNFALRADGGFRRGFDLSTPAGNLRNTGIHTVNGSVGMSYIQPWGYLGAAGSYYESRYGIPGGFAGAHPNGVTIDLDRWHTELRADVHAPLPGIERIELHGTFSRYFHAEYESNGALGMDFGVLTYTATALARTDTIGILHSGSVGLRGEYRDYATGGLSFTPQTQEYAASAFAYQQADIGPVTVQGALRFDYRSIQPEEKMSTRIGAIRRRDFADVSGSIAVAYTPAPPLTVELTLMRTFRAPGVEELYTEGPHLAAYTYETGNPALNRETGFGIEAMLRYKDETSSFSLALFRNAIADYMYPRNTGDTNYRVLLPVYQFSGADALMIGGEATAEWRLGSALTAGLTASYVQGRIVESGTPLPMMPPLQGSLRLRYVAGGFSATAAVRGAADQRQLGEFEEATAGYAVLDLAADYTFGTEALLHTLTLTLDNATNREYRRHLSRVKAIMPEPGRNIRLLYRLYF